MTSIYPNISSLNVCSNLQAFAGSDICEAAAQNWGSVTSALTSALSNFAEDYSNFDMCQELQGRVGLDFCQKKAELMESAVSTVLSMREAVFSLIEKMPSIDRNVAAVGSVAAIAFGFIAIQSAQVNGLEKRIGILEEQNELLEKLSAINLLTNMDLKKQVDLVKVATVANFAGNIEQENRSQTRFNFLKGGMEALAGFVLNNKESEVPATESSPVLPQVEEA